MTTPLLELSRVEGRLRFTHMNPNETPESVLSNADTTYTLWVEPELVSNARLSSGLMRTVYSTCFVDITGAAELLGLVSTVAGLVKRDGDIYRWTPQNRDAELVLGEVRLVRHGPIWATAGRSTKEKVTIKTSDKSETGDPSPWHPPATRFLQRLRLPLVRGLTEQEFERHLVNIGFYES